MTRQHTYRHNVVSQLLRRTPLKGLVQTLTENAAPKPLILLLGVHKLGSNIFQFHAQLGIGVLEMVFLPPDLSQHAFASL